MEEAGGLLMCSTRIPRNAQICRMAESTYAEYHTRAIVNSTTAWAVPPKEGNAETPSLTRPAIALAFPRSTVLSISGTAPAARRTAGRSGACSGSLHI